MNHIKLAIGLVVATAQMFHTLKALKSVSAAMRGL